MEKLGVEAVVEGVKEFLGNLTQMDKGIGNLVPNTNWLSSALSTLGDIATSVGGWIANTLAVAIGNILADAVEWATAQLAEMVAMAIEAGEQFQSLEIRLNQMNFNKATESTDDYTAAMQTATEMTQEQLAWIQKLAVTTPFEVTDIANVYSLARSYDFADQDARDLTETISDFAAGMGLGSVEIERIIKNFGQMQQQGKVTQRELNDLARGAFVPVNDILAEMQKQTGLTGKEFDAFRNSAEGVDMFMAKFAELVDTKFAGASEKAARTLKAATLNLKEFFSSFAASGVIKPVFDLLGGKIADINDALTARLPEIISGFERIGDVVVEILGGILDLAPGADEMADGFISALDGIANWLESHKDDIVAFFKAGYDFITGTMIPALKDLKDWFFGTPAQPETQGTAGDGVATGASEPTGDPAQVGFLQKTLDLLKQLQPLVAPIQDLFKSLLGVASELMGITFGELSDKGFADTVKSVAEALEGLAKWIGENKELIAQAIKAWLEWQLTVLAIKLAVEAIIGVVAKVVTAIAGFLLGLNAVVGVITWFIVPLFNWIVAGLGAIATALGLPVIAVVALIAGIAWAATMIYLHGEQMGTTLKQLGFLIGFYFDQMVNSVVNWVRRMATQFDTWKNNTINAIIAWKNQTLANIVAWVALTVAKAIEWATTFAGKVNELKQKVIDKFNELKSGVIQKLNEIKSSIKSILTNALNSIRDLNFFSIGENLMSSLAQGIIDGAESVFNAIDQIAGQMTSNLMGALQMGSPSKVMIRVGSDIDKGLAIGIESYAGLVTDAMDKMASMAMSPLSTMPSLATAAATSNVTTNNTSNYNLTINSGANTEPIIQDFAMLRSLG